MKPAFPVLLACTALAALALPAAAAPILLADVPADRFLPALDARGLLDVESASAGRHLDASAALWLGYEHAPLVLRTGGTATALVEHRGIARATASLSLFDALAVGVEMPFVAVQSGVGITPLAIGDVRVAPKLQLVSHFVDVAVVAAMTLPTSTKGAHMGDRMPTLRPELLLGWELGAVRVLLQAGALVREEATFRGAPVGSELTARGGVGWRLPTDDVVPIELAWTMSGAMPLAAAAWPAETALAARFDVLPTLQLVTYAGAGIGGGVGTPSARAGLAVAGTFDFQSDADVDAASSSQENLQ